MDYKEKVIALLNSKELSQEQKEKLESIFPELKESEDERIRKEIEQLIQCMHDADPRKERWLAWLEKQDESKSYSWKPTEEQFEALDYAYNSCNDTERGNYYEGVLMTLIEDLHRLEKQGEQPKDVICTYETETGNGNIKALVTKKIQHSKKPKKQGETNPYSGISFEYNGHIWGMCARDNGVDILLDKQLVNHLEMRNEQNQKVNYPKFEFKDVLALQCCIETVKKVIEYKNLYEQLQSLHSRLYDAYQLKKKYEQKLL